MIDYFRLSGGGNDFLALVDPPSAPPPERIRSWCRRGVSAGADGLFLLSRTRDGARVTHYNADGGRAELCLNGVRCAARLALYLGWAERRLPVETDAGTLWASEAGDERTRIELVPPTGEPRELRLTAGGQRLAAWLIVVGVPHLVVPFSPGVAAAPVARLGPELRAHPEAGAAGANVDFVRYSGRRRLEIRTYERGVEAETLACGTGVLAAVAVGVHLDRLSLPAEAMTRGGYPFTVDGRSEAGKVHEWALTADARLIARGTLLPGADADPAAPGGSRGRRDPSRPPGDSETPLL